MTEITIAISLSNVAKGDFDKVLWAAQKAQLELGKLAKGGADLDVRFSDPVPPAAAAP